MVSRKPLAVAAVLALVAATALLALGRLEGAACWVVGASAGEALRAPTPDFEIGGVRWHPGELARDPALEPFRRDFLAHCAGRLGRDAALCVARHLADAFPWGGPRSDFFAPKFNPATDLAAHLAGEPGHCVPRSGITVDELLSVGIPARIAQLFPATGGAHNIVEVWDAGSGWTLVDPSYGGVLERGGRPLSAVAILERNGAIDTVGSPVLGGGERYYRSVPWLGGAVVYPEPWLYVRSGRRAAPRPFHGRFARVGGHALRLGVGQWLLRLAFVVFGLGAAFAFAVGLRARLGNATDGSDIVPVRPEAPADAASAFDAAVDETVARPRRSARR